MKWLVRISSLWLISCLVACHTIKPYYGDKSYNLKDLPTEAPLSQIVLVGDAGDMQEEEPIRAYVRQYLEIPGALIFLGDNIYTYGLPEESAPDYDEKRIILENQMELAEGYTGKVIFIPGNHDWKKSHEGGLQAVLRQEAYVTNFYSNSETFQPGGGCPGPTYMKLSEETGLILIDSEWWLHKYEKPGPDACDFGTPEAVSTELKRLVEAHKDEVLVVAAHHPIVSNGEHGGYFSAMDHIFPLKNVVPWLYFPLPVIGSIYPLSRHWGVSSQDIPNKDFQTYKAMLEESFGDHPSLIYVSGHEHNLQLHQQERYTQVISGAGSKTNFARKGLGASYVQQQEGFARLLFYADSVWVEFIVVDNKKGGMEVTYRDVITSSN